MSDTSSNPYQAPTSEGSTGAPKSADAVKLSKHIDNLYRNSKQMVLLTCLGVFVPLVLVIAAPVGLLYAFQRSRLIKNVKSGAVRPSADDAEKFDYLYWRGLRFYAPAIIVVGYALIIWLAVAGRA